MNLLLRGACCGLLVAMGCTRPMATEDIDSIAKGNTFDRVGERTAGRPQRREAKVAPSYFISGTL